MLGLSLGFSEVRDAFSGDSLEGFLQGVYEGAFKGSTSLQRLHQVWVEGATHRPLSSSFLGITL